MNLIGRLIIMLTLVGVVNGECTSCERCVNDTCRDPVINKCTCKYGCKPGYYGGRCLKECPEQCYTCGREYGLISDPTYRICYKCKDGYHNGSSTNCLCPINCQECTSSTQCTLCYPGRYGNMCQLACPPNCKDNICGKSDGLCTDGCIIESLVGDDCNDCRRGFYGDNCDLSCPPNCKDNVCTKTTGQCKYGCKSDKFESFECNVCKTGFHGEECNLECPKNCKLINCSRLTGECTQECTGKSIERRCDVCVDGFYGVNCSIPCPSSNCFNNLCNVSSGECERCQDGFYGLHCDIKCHRRCVGNKCNQIDGHCIDGSQDNLEETKEDAHSTALIVGWIFGGCCFTLNVVLVSYIYNLRRQIATTESERDVGHNENQATYVNNEVEIVTVRPEQVNMYEDLNRRKHGETSVYSDLQ